MASVMRVRIGCIARKFMQYSLSNTGIRDKNVCYFHRSAFLGVTGQEVKMPALSPTMSEGTIVKWLKKEGDTLAPGDVLCEIQTDKAIVGMETEEEGILAKILVPESSSKIQVGTLIALTVKEGEDWKNVEVSASALPPPSQAATSAPSGAPAGTGAGSASDFEVTVFPGAKFYTATLKSFGPAARALFEKYDLKSNAVQPTGHRSKLLKEDVLKYIKDHNLTEKPIKAVPPPSVKLPSKPASKPPLVSGRAPKKQAASAFIDNEVSSMRKTIARRLSESKQRIPHCYGSIESDISRITELRKALKVEKINVSVNDFVMKAAGCALQQFPQVNCHWINDQLVPLRSIDVCVAVATDQGLITPIVPDVPGKGVIEISHMVKDLAGRARKGKLKPHEFQGGSFTISNLGMFGIKEFCAIINPPQVAILAVGAGQLTLSEELKVSNLMRATLSFDRRAFDDDIAAEFLKAFQTMIEDPSKMLLGGSIGQRIALESGN